MSFYFEEFEDRKPPRPVPYSALREGIWQMFATITLVLGGWYIIWRWGWSLNMDALWYSIPVAFAETAAYVGMFLFVHNLWAHGDTPIVDPPKLISDCDPLAVDRKVSVDVFFPSYDEEPELVRLSIEDAKKIRYPHPIDINIHVLDDGKRPEMQALAEELDVNYITRDSNVGFKAGNLRNAMELTGGDFIVICDADTRPFPGLLENTLGYFCDPEVAWVQTPQWFFDLPAGHTLDRFLGKFFGSAGRSTGRLVQKMIGEVVIGKDPFVNDPQMFYDVIQRRRNRHHGSFCCGAGSIHRREAVMEAALKAYALQIDDEVRKFTDEIDDSEIAGDLSQAMRKEAAIDTEFTPYKFHVSEDIYTSIVLHSDRSRNWKSVFHPQVESKMLSPQDLQTWTVQRFKYAGGTLDICMHDNPLVGSDMKLHRKIFYGATFWSNFGSIWNVIFLLAPVVFMFTGIAPVASYSFDFFIHLLPFIIASELAMMVGTWGVAGFKGKASYLAFFPVGLRALWTVLKGQQIKFPATPKDRQEGNFFRLVLPQVTVIALTVIGLIVGYTRVFIFDNPDQLSAMVVNTFWSINNIVVLSGIVFAAFWRPQWQQAELSHDISTGTTACPQSFVLSYGIAHRFWYGVLFGEQSHVTGR